jgi:hypothetical protein
MPAVERADPHRERQVEARLVGGQLEVLDRHPTHAERPRGDLGGRAPLDERDAPGGPVDHEDVAVPDPAGDLSGGRARGATDLEHAQAGAQRQGVDDRREASGQAGHPTTMPDGTGATHAADRRG